jgi:glycosyltransferase involved in cell wall biosynthesis
MAVAAAVLLPRITTTVPQVLRGRDIICISNDWSGDPLSKTHLMRLLARDNRVLWVNSIGYRAPTVCRADISRAFTKLWAAMQPLHEPEPNLFVLNPLAIPGYRAAGIRSLNRHLLRLQIQRAMRRLNFRKPISWSFLPSAAVVAGSLGEDVVVYHCVDEFTQFKGVSAQGLAELEARLVRRADLVIVSADRLYHSKKQLNPNTVLVRHGVDHAHFRRALHPATQVPSALAGLPRPVIGFFGLIADWVDVELIAQVARHFATGSVVLIGKATTDVAALRAIPNVHLLGRKPYQDLPAYCKGFDVAINPFRINELTLNSNPLKVREYLAAGLPVVSTAIPEVEVLGQCHIGETPARFVAELQAALAQPGPRAWRSEAIRAESWEARMEEIRRHFTAEAIGRGTWHRGNEQ